MKHVGLYKHIGVYDFEQAFKSMGRQDQFTYAGRKALFEYLEQLSEDIGEPIELDVIALCCEYQEMENIKEFNGQYSTAHNGYEDIDETTVIAIDNESFIIQQF